MNSIIKITIAILGTLLFSCSGEKIVETQQEAVQQKASLESESAPEFKIDSVDLEIGCAGKIVVPPQGTIEISAGIGANVYQIKVLPGTSVKKGEILAYLQHRNIITLQTEYLSIREKTTVLESDYQRKAELFESNAISDKEFQLVKGNYLESKARLQGLEKELQLIGLSGTFISQNGVQLSAPLRATHDGTVQMVYVNEGKYVQEGDPVFTIVNTNTLHLDIDVFAKDAGYIRPGQTVHFMVPGIAKTYEAKIHLIAAALNDNNTLNVHAEISKEQAELLKPGIPVQAKVDVGRRERHLISASSIVFENGQPFLKSQRQTALELGSLVDGYYEVLNPWALE